MTETTTTDSAELADLLVELARYANSVAAQCRDLATTRGDLHITNQYGLVAGQAAEAAGRAIGWARQLRDSHAIIIGSWPQSDERGHDLGPTIDGVQTVRGDTIEHQDHVGDDWPIIIERGHDIPDDWRAREAAEAKETPFDVVGPDDVRLADDHPDGAVGRVFPDEDTIERALARHDPDGAYEATWSDREHDRDEDYGS